MGIIDVQKVQLESQLDFLDMLDSLALKLKASLLTKQSFKEIDNRIPDIAEEITAILKKSVRIKIKVDIIEGITGL